MEIIKNIVYTKVRDNRCAYDLYLPDNADTLLIYFYGGSLKKGSKDGCRFPSYLAEAGIAVAVPDYRLMPDVSYPDFICDAADAVAAVINMYGRRFNKLFVGGHSAGAYLSMMLCFDRHYLKERGIADDVINGYCFISGQPTKHFSILEAEGDDPRHLVVDSTSALWHVGENCTPVLIITSDNDMANRREQNILLNGTLNCFGNGNHTVYVEIPGCTHGGFVKPDKNGNIPVLPYLLSFFKL